MNHYKDGKGKIKSFLDEKWMKIAVLLMLWDIVAIHAAYILALWFRFDCKFSAISASYLNQYPSKLLEGDKKYTLYYNNYCALIPDKSAIPRI